MSRWVCAIAAILVGCSDVAPPDSAPTQLADTGVTDTVDAPAYDTRVIEIDSEAHDSCRPVPRDDACSDVSCGATHDGCGGFYFCVIESVSLCSECAPDDSIVCPETSPSGYRCSPGTLPLGCLDLRDGSWCCLEF